MEVLNKHKENVRGLAAPKTQTSIYELAKVPEGFPTVQSAHAPSQPPRERGLRVYSPAAIAGGQK